MEWPDHAAAMPFITQITADLCHGATYYADLIHEKLKAAGYYDEIGQFDVTEQVSFTFCSLLGTVLGNVLVINIFCK